jgi:hypothetical protein
MAQQCFVEELQGRGVLQCVLVLALQDRGTVLEVVVEADNLHAPY